MTRDELLDELETCIGVLTLQSPSGARLTAWLSLLADVILAQAVRKALDGRDAHRLRFIAPLLGLDGWAQVESLVRAIADVLAKEAVNDPR